PILLTTLLTPTKLQLLPYTTLFRSARFVVGDHAMAVAGDHRQFGQGPSQLGERDEFARGLQRRRHIGKGVGAFVHEFVRLGLDQIGRAHGCSPVTLRSRMPSSAWKK